MPAFGHWRGVTETGGKAVRHVSWGVLGCSLLPRPGFDCQLVRINSERNLFGWLLVVTVYDNFTHANIRFHRGSAEKAISTLTRELS